ncbi:hypothetical protein V1L52_08455 [Treponema sp. HNW]|uniref:hypothetical protein n=1 Tax=Treponema sp. HNW TaxID=3116654 RepID=UPI003D12A592
MKKNENQKYILKLTPYGRLDLQGYYTGLSESENGIIASVIQDDEDARVQIFDGLQSITEEYLYILHRATNVSKNDVYFVKI